MAGALRRKLVRIPPLTGPFVTNATAYNNYLIARALIKKRDPRLGETAADLLRDAIAIDPGYAPAWASLASATYMESASKGHEVAATSLPKVQAYARRSLRLASDFAEAHRALAQALGYGNPEGMVHAQRAAQIDPNSAENWLALGAAYGAAGEFDQELAAYRRAAEVDPLWYRATGVPAFATAEMGDRAEAETIVRRGFATDQFQQHIALGRIAWIVGDFSAAARQWSIAAGAKSPHWNNIVQRAMTDLAFTLGLGTRPYVAHRLAPPPAERWLVRVLMDAPPTFGVWQARNRDPIVAEIYRGENLVAAKLMLNAGRGLELVATYDRPAGLLGLRPGHSLRVDQLSAVPVVAIALRQVNRDSEADRLLQQADTLTRAVYRRGRVPRRPGSA